MIRWYFERGSNVTVVAQALQGDGCEVIRAMVQGDLPTGDCVGDGKTQPLNAGGTLCFPEGKHGNRIMNALLMM